MKDLPGSGERIVPMSFQRNKSMPRVGAAMTPFPYFTRPQDNVEKVERMMNEHEIRHIPVLEDGRVVGIVSERDFHIPVSPVLPKIDKQQILVRDVAFYDPYVVEIDTPLDQVVSKMAEDRIGSAIVVKKGKLVGILSVIDVCHVLADLLKGLFPTPEEDDAA